MATKTLTVREYMSSLPISVGQEQTLDHAARLMREHQLRHLPVLSGGTLHGVLTDRDINLVESLEGVDPAVVLVEEAMTTEPFATRPEAPLQEVVAKMAAEKYGCALVMEKERVVGIFTTVDACRALAEQLQQEKVR